MIYFTSDLHFFSKKSLCVGGREFPSAQERGEFLAEQWNRTVAAEDEVYLLGDISNGSGEETGRMLERLNGRKYLIIGNNDRYLDDPAFDRSVCRWYRQYYELRAMDTRFILFHFPIEVWTGYKKDRVHLHGHLHREKPVWEPIRRYEVGVDAHDGRPVSIEEIWEAVKDLHNMDRKVEGVW